MFIFELSNECMKTLTLAPTCQPSQSFKETLNYFVVSSTWQAAKVAVIRRATYELFSNAQHFV